MIGIWLAVISAIGYTGANLALRQVARPNDLDWAVWVSCMKAVPPTVTAWALIGWRASRGLPALPPRNLLLPLIAASLLMQFGGNVMFQWSLGYGGLSITVPVVFATIVSSSAWLGHVYLRDPVTKRMLVAIGILFASILFLTRAAEQNASTSTQVPPWTAAMFAVAGAGLAGVTYGVNGVYIRKLVTAKLSLSASLVMFSTTGVVCLGAWALIRLGPSGIASTTPTEWRALAVAGMMTAVAFFALGGALKRLSVCYTNLLNASQNAMCAMAGVALFGEKTSGWMIFGCVLTIVGLCIVDERQANPASEQTDHA